MSKEQEELKPCPFCGSEARLDQRVTQSLWNSNDAVFSQVTCDECEISGQDFCDDPDGEEAIAWWNRRQQAPAEQEPVAWLVTESSMYKDRAHISKRGAEKAAMDRADGSIVVPLYAAPPDQSARIAELEHTMREAVDYLDSNKLNSIGYGSKLHRFMQDALAKH